MLLFAVNIVYTHYTVANNKFINVFVGSICSGLAAILTESFDVKRVKNIAFTFAGFPTPAYGRPSLRTTGLLVTKC